MEWVADADFMVQVAGADPAASNALVLRLQRRVRRIARGLLYSQADADDAAQASLMEILRSASSYRAECSLERWADRITVRTALRLARERRMWSVRTDGQADVESLAAHGREDSVAADLPRHIAAYLAELPETRRTALVLKHAMGYTVEEIAELTSASINTVKDRLLQARQQVRRLVRRDVAMTTRGGA